MDKIKDLIRADKLDLAINALLSSEIEEHHKQELLLLSARLKRQRVNSRKGISTSGEENIELNRIRSSIIEIISDIESTLPILSNSDYFDKIDKNRSTISEIMSSITTLKEETVIRENRETNQINNLLKQAESKQNFDKIHNVIKIASIKIREDNHKLEEDVEEFKLLVHEIRFAYYALIGKFNELNIKEKSQLIESVNSFCNLQYSYTQIISEFQKGVHLRETTSLGSKFGGYNRAVKKGIEIEKGFIKSLEEQLETMKNLAANELLIR